MYQWKCKVSDTCDTGPALIIIKVQLMTDDNIEHASSVSQVTKVCLCFKVILQFWATKCISHKPVDQKYVDHIHVSHKHITHKPVDQKHVCQKHIVHKAVSQKHNDHTQVLTSSFRMYKMSLPSIYTLFLKQLLDLSIIFPLKHLCNLWSSAF